MTEHKTKPHKRMYAAGLARRYGVLRARDLAAQGLAPAEIQRLVRRGLLVREGRGLYAPSGYPVTEHHTFATVAKRVPNGVVSLLSALAFHNIGTQLPYQVWLAVDRKAWTPRGLDLPVRIVRFSGSALTEGVRKHRVDGVSVRVYSLAKTVADCFKYRHKIGLDIALEALRESWRARRVTMEELTHYADVCRVRRIMQPYLESLA
jgi:predicted transcriptional regulator of viral defense system